MGRKNTHEDFVTKASKIHNGYYTYPISDYSGPNYKVTVKCPIHGIYRPFGKSHLSGAKCRRCSSGTISETEFIQHCDKVHNHKYIYTKSKYTTKNHFVSIECPTHGDFKQRAMEHWNGSGCSKCFLEKTNYDKYNGVPTILYYIHFSDLGIYKIGITKTSVQQRFKKEINAGTKINIISTKHFQDGYQAFLLEQQILSYYDDKMWEPKTKEKFVGWTECFVEDVLKEYNK